MLNCVLVVCTKATNTSINQSINQHHGLSPMQEVAAIYSEKLMPSVSS